MLNNKSLLYGLGTGLIMGAVLLQLMNSVPSAGNAAPKTAVPNPTIEDLDQKQVKEIASKYFQVFDKADKLYSQPQVDVLIQQKVKEEKDKQAAQPPAPVQTKETYVYIAKGLVASNVADMLYQSGMITDRKAFEDEMNRKQLNDKIVPGIHVFKGPQELAQVINSITTP
jgi:phage-related minor tail protein